MLKTQKNHNFPVKFSLHVYLTIEIGPKSKEFMIYEHYVTNLESGAYNSAQLSVYLVFFHSARAVLFRDGIREKSHYCLGIYLDLAYHKKSLLEEEYILLFNRMRTARHQQQYSFHTKPTMEELIETIKSVRDFKGRISRLLED